MDERLYEDLAPKYKVLLLEDIDAVVEGLITDKAHIEQFEFRFDLFKKNFETFQDLFKKTHTVENPGQYNDFINNIKLFIKIIQLKKQKSYLTNEDVSQVREVARLFRDLS